MKKCREKGSGGETCDALEDLKDLALSYCGVQKGNQEDGGSVEGKTAKEARGGTGGNGP